MALNVTTGNFQDEVINADIPVLIDFWAPWCGPCKAIAPVVEEIAKDFSGKIKVCKLNVDEAPEIATQYAVMSIPTLMLIKDGKVMETKIGAMSKGDITKLIAPYV